jgi:4a-hydroxytetrahydrobiopterin dehydratase
MTTTLETKKCVPCEGGVTALKGEALTTYMGYIDRKWSCHNEHQIKRMFTFPDFAEALNFVNEVGDLAESEGHHPDLYLAWGKVEVTLWTHAIDGLSENDFILAKKIDGLY